MSADELHSGATTVLELSKHFDRLKERATELLNTFQSSTRGYFTPTEDEQTRHLLVSYWQSRNALFELVSSFHRVDRFESEEQPIALLIAYSGALVLVDVARFLRENCHHRPVVREKLNEPEPYFGIPEGTYDLVQKSLTSPVHAWHLYHASVYVREHRPQLSSLINGSADFEELLEIVGRLQNRLDITAEKYVLARSRVRAASLGQRISRDLLGRALYGLQKCVSRLIADRYVKSGHQPGLPSEVESRIEADLRPGDVIVVRKEHAFTNYFLPGYWPHAALYLGSLDDLRTLQLHEHDNIRTRWNTLETVDTQRSTRVLESMKDGVRVRSLSNPFRSDAIAVIRPQLTTPEIAEAIGRGFFHADKPYDFDFDFARSDRLVCTEVVYRAYESIGGIAFNLTRRAGRMTLSAEDLLQMAVDNKSFDPLAVYCPAMSDVVQYGEHARTALSSTIGRKSV